MELIETLQEICKANTDIQVRMRHHAPAVQRVADMLVCCIFGNPTVIVEGMNRNGRYGYCYKVTSANNKVFYLTYDHDTETIYSKNSYRNPTSTHVFNNNATSIQIASEVRALLQ